ncbi:Hsp70 family protein [Marinobacter gelidimuriae]|jgi:molecular chaperone DnaK|uniref:Hsp70 family protein n=1 Tax=Marinobacter gelidimuriae TaxID=2739064 RepID=UPI00036B4B69|nr:Hsp70 family protein [Marinobacter gelidimuriae]
MNHFVGIDLGTTNSAICSYDGSETRIWKSPEQNDVTPSVIYIDRRGNKYIGKRAYDSAPHSPDNSASLFKRLMGTSTPVELPAVNQTKTPEECSAEVLKTLYGYLPEEVRRDPDTGTVITVPAAFNQMQRDATMQAANMAGIGNVALMQEPVAAVMSVMRKKNVDGMFLIYDLGGGTLDIAVAESIGGRINLHAHGGISMCGGRDFDRVLLDNVVKPWLIENFNLPENFSSSPDYKSLIRLATWATERAKIELSSSEQAAISLTEVEARAKDLDGEEIYLDVSLTRQIMDELIADRLSETINAARETLSNASLSPHDLERVVFVGGPTNYKPLRDKVAFELGIPGNTDVNPMTAVAEGASIFAESIDWSTQTRGRKGNRGTLSNTGNLDISFNYISRTPDLKAKMAVKIPGEIPEGSEFQVDSVDTGWTSGRVPLANGATLTLNLAKPGENNFKVAVFDASGGPVSLAQDTIIITRTAASVDAIPASYSIAVEVLNKLGGRPEPDYLVRAGDHLPAKGKRIYKAAESLKAGASGSLNFILWEGEIGDPIRDNRPVGSLKISGNDFDEGVIPAGADLECEYEILDSGNIIFNISIPSIGGTFHSDRNFYSPQGGMQDYSASADAIVEEGEKTRSRVDDFSARIDDPRLTQARDKLQQVESIDETSDPESAKQAMENILDAKRLIADVKKAHLKETRTIELEHVVDFFDNYVRGNARPSEASSFDALAHTARSAIQDNDTSFDNHLDELRGKNFEILWRQDWFVVEKFKSMAKAPQQFTDRQMFTQLVQAGMDAMEKDDIDRLRAVIAELSQIQAGIGAGDELFDVANIIKG